MSARRSVLVLAHVRDRGVLTAARALRRAGWRVGLGAVREGGGLIGASGAVDRIHPVPRPRGELAPVVQALRAAVREGGYDLVMGCGDDWLVAVSHAADQLGVPVAHPPAEVVDRALDKLELTRLAQQAGLGHLRTELALGARSWPLPAVVKNRAHWSPGQERAFRVETEVCHTRAELRRAVDRLRASGDVPVLQEHTHGRLMALIGLMHDGRLTGRVQQVSPRLWPVPAGASARAVTVPVDTELAARSERMLRTLGWTGLVELQFLQGEDGVPRLIDLNGRVFGSLALSESARPGLVDAWARSALGEPVPALADGRAGQRYQWLAGDLRRALAERRGGLARDVTRSLLWAVGSRHSVVTLRDPGPALRLATARLRPEVEPVTRDSPAEPPQQEPLPDPAQPRRRSVDSTEAATIRSGARWTARAS